MKTYRIRPSATDTTVSIMRDDVEVATCHNGGTAQELVDALNKSVQVDHPFHCPWCPEMFRQVWELVQHAWNQHNTGIRR